MGFQEELVSKALRHTNNEMNQSIEVMNENPALLLTNYDDQCDHKKVTKEMIENVASMGFPKGKIGLSAYYLIFIMNY